MVVLVVVDDADATNSDDLPLPMLPLVLELMLPLRPSTELFVDVPAPDKESKWLAKEADESFKMLMLPLPPPPPLLLVACGSSVPKPPPRLLANCSLPNGPPGNELVAADVLRFWA